MSNVIVIGGGAAGMLTAISASELGHQVTLCEKNEKLGKKIFITGKGRCNLTNNCSTDAFFKNVVHNPKFLYSALHTFDCHSIMDMMEEEGCSVKTERGDRVFPASDHSSDVIQALEKRLKTNGVKILLNTRVQKLVIEDDRVTGIKTASGEQILADAVIVATGGMSYPSTGSNGDGYKLAKEAGHTVTKLSPGLVPMVTEEEWCRSLQGLSLKNVGIIFLQNGKTLYQEQGEMLFTHFGLSGPLILSASSYFGDRANKMQGRIDLKPALTEEQLDKRLLRDFEENQNKDFGNSLQKLFPTKLIPVMIQMSGIEAHKKVNEITKEERKHFVELIKGLPFTVSGTRDYNEAIITQGGVDISQVNPSTMESKLKKNLFFVGEVLDVDALTGGFNLQIAWSTGYLCGQKIQWV